MDRERTESFFDTLVDVCRGLTFDRAPVGSTFEGVQVDVNEHGRVLFPVKVKWLSRGALPSWTVIQVQQDEFYGGG